MPSLLIRCESEGLLNPVFLYFYTCQHRFSTLWKVAKPIIESTPHDPRLVFHYADNMWLISSVEIKQAYPNYPLDCEYIENMEVRDFVDGDDTCLEVDTYFGDHLPILEVPGNVVFHKSGMWFELLLEKEYVRPLVIKTERIDYEDLLGEDPFNPKEKEEKEERPPTVYGYAKDVHNARVHCWHPGIGLFYDAECGSCYRPLEDIATMTAEEAEGPEALRCGKCWR